VGVPEVVARMVPKSAEQSTDPAQAVLVEMQQGLFRYAYLLCGAAEDAHDLTQATTLRLLESSENFTAAGYPTAYARRTMTNLYLNHRRRELHLRSLLPSLWRVDAEPGSDAAVEDRVQLGSLLSELPGHQKAAIVLRFYYDAATPAIASALGCPEATVRSLIQRGLGRLRVALNDEGGRTG
jgi:RNA polymerase sigma factor (sigma-70 family)